MKKTAVLLILLGAVLNPAHATVVVTPDAETPLTTGGAVYGWQFNVTTALTVDKLGFYDEGQDGLADSHEIGIWNSAGDLLVSAGISAGTSAPLDGIFRIVDVADVFLSVGTGYVIGATRFGNDQMVRDPSSLTVQPGIQFVGGRYLINGGLLLEKPVQTAGAAANGYYGPTFVAGQARGDVSLPATIALLGMGITGLGILRRRKTR